MKRSSFQADLNASPAMLTYGTNLTIPGDLLRDPGQESKPDLKSLVKFMEKVNNKPPIQTSIKPQTPVEPPPKTVKHVYTKQHKTVGLQAPYCGPFPIVSRPSRSTVKIKVGVHKDNSPRFEVRHWRDLKICHLPTDAKEAQRPKLGRPAKNATASADSPNQTDGSEAVKPVDGKGKVNNPNELIPVDAGPDQNKRNSNAGGKLPPRSTRNPKPNYVDSLIVKQNAWSAGPEDLAEINRSINTRQI